jgi:hypothetical protein
MCCNLIHFNAVDAVNDINIQYSMLFFQNPNKLPASLVLPKFPPRSAASENTITLPPAPPTSSSASDLPPPPPPPSPASSTGNKSAEKSTKLVKCKGKLPPGGAGKSSEPTVKKLARTKGEEIRKRRAEGEELRKRRAEGRLHRTVEKTAPIGSFFPVTPLLGSLKTAASSDAGSDPARQIDRIREHRANNGEDEDADGRHSETEEDQEDAIGGGDTGMEEKIRSIRSINKSLNCIKTVDRHVVKLITCVKGLSNEVDALRQMVCDNRAFTMYVDPSCIDKLPLDNNKDIAKYLGEDRFRIPIMGLVMRMALEFRNSKTGIGMASAIVKRLLTDDYIREHFIVTNRY